MIKRATAFLLFFAILQGRSAGGLDCYSCHNARSISDCSTVTTCADGHVCDSYFVNGLYSLGCINETECSGNPLHIVGRAIERPSRDVCHECCDVGRCNNELCGAKPPVTTLQPRVCRDALDTCGLLDQSYYCNGSFLNWAIQNCQKTCQLCGVTPGPTPPTTMSPSRNQTITVCEAEQASITCPAGYLINIYAAVYGRTGVVPADACNPHHAHITNFQCKVNKYEYIRQRCDGQNKCSVTNSHETFADPCPGTPKYLKIDYNCEGGCDYNGRTYRDGEVWQDGCRYNCTCEDASVGFYKCVDLCPKYLSLPAGCSLVTQSGECCAKPNCSVPTVTTHHWGPENVLPCYYKGNYYTQGQTWDDGCNQTCTCTNYYNNGFYSCRGRCLTWNNLPPVCHLDDAPPGLCCQQPRCPSSIIVTVPKGYEKEYPGFQVQEL